MDWHMSSAQRVGQIGAAVIDKRAENGDTGGEGVLQQVGTVEQDLAWFASSRRQQAAALHERVLAVRDGVRGHGQERIRGAGYWLLGKGTDAGHRPLSRAVVARSRSVAFRQ